MRRRLRGGPGSYVVLGKSRTDLRSPRGRCNPPGSSCASAPHSGGEPDGSSCAIVVVNATAVALEVKTQGADTELWGVVEPGERISYNEPCSTPQIVVTGTYTDSRLVPGRVRVEDRLTQQRQIFATGHPKPGEVETIRLQ